LAATKDVVSSPTKKFKPTDQKQDTQKDEQQNRVIDEDVLSKLNSSNIYSKPKAEDATIEIIGESQFDCSINED